MNRNFRGHGWSLSLLLALNVSTESHAFIFIKGSNYNKGGRPISAAPIWDQRKVKFYVNPNLQAYDGTETPEITAEEFLRAAEIGIGAWSNACRSDLSVELAGTTERTVSASDGISTITYDNRAQGDNYFGYDQNILASAATALSGTSFTDCDIVVNGMADAHFRIDGSTGSKVYDIASILAHEVGHCLGLDHPVEPPDFDVAGATDSERDATFLHKSTMIQSAVLLVSGDTRRRTIDQDDRDGIDCIYERGKPFRSGTRCSSYHGTNGGASLSGVISGGPTEDRGNVCGSEGDGRTVSGIEDDSSPGCVGSAFASPEDRRPITPSPFDFWTAILAFGFFRIIARFRRRLSRSSA